MFLALLMAAAQPAAPAISHASPATIEAPIRADSMALVKVLNPDGPMVDMVVRNFRNSMDSTVAGNEDYLALEKDYPGISKALIDAMTETMRADLVSDLPVLRGRYAHFYAELFTADETAELIRLYTSKSGHALVAAKFAKIDATPLMADFVADPDSPVSQQHIRDINRTATRSILTEMSDEDKAALLDFAKTPAFRKLASARDSIEQFEATIANEPDPQLDAALDAATREVFVKFTGEAPGEE